jgi:hypothetical protein
VQAIADEHQRCVHGFGARAATCGDQHVVADLDRRGLAVGRYQLGHRRRLVHHLLLKGNGLEVAVHPGGLQAFGFQTPDHIVCRAQVIFRAGQASLHPVIGQGRHVGPPLGGRLCPGRRNNGRDRQRGDGDKQQGAQTAGHGKSRLMTINRATGLSA